MPFVTMPAPLFPDAAIRLLDKTDQQLFLDHLLRLDIASRRDRFNGLADDDFVSRYAERCFSGQATVLGLESEGRIVAAAELHESGTPGPRSGEVAFSVEKAYQGRGIGTMLFERLLGQARAQGYGELEVTTHAQNEAMTALARKFDAALAFRHAEAHGVIRLDTTNAPDNAGTDPAQDGTERSQVPTAAHFAGMFRAMADIRRGLLGTVR